MFWPYRPDNGFQLRTPFVSPFGFGGTLTDPPWSLSGETARMSITVSAGKCHDFIIDRRKVEMEKKALLNDKSHYAVIFTSIQSEVNKDYEEMVELMISLAKKQPGFLRVDSALSNGIGITVSYWETEEAIRNWKNHEKHLVAWHKGRSGWYNNFHVSITQVEREYELDSREKMK